jgi:RNA polymerase sigma-70 factor (sigma-E family)
VDFSDFVNARLPALLRYATVVSCDPHLAEDIVQEVLLRAQQRWSRVRRTEQPEAYVKRMVLNEFLSWRRRRAAREVPLSNGRLDEAGGARDDPAAVVDERDELVRHIAGLPPRQRAVLALRYFEGLTDAEIAAQMQLREVTVRSHCSRALATLRTAMTPATASLSGGLQWSPNK